MPKTKRHNLNPQYNTLLNYILLFLFCAFLGWVWEVALTFVKTGNIVNRGVLHGAWLPIYGFGGVFMAMFLHHFEKHPLAIFSLSALVCGIMEYFTGWYLETFKHLKWWDYSDLWLNLHGRICAISVLAVGFCGLFVVYILKPFLFKHFDKIQLPAKLILCSVLLVCIITDAAYSSTSPNTGEGITLDLGHYINHPPK